MSARYACDGITKRGGRCLRAATKHFTKGDGTCVNHYCTAHANGAGVMRMLRPLPWEYARVEDYGGAR